MMVLTARLETKDTGGRTTSTGKANSKITHAITLFRAHHKTCGRTLESGLIEYTWTTLGT